jgi:hypothetical protein
MTKPKAKHIVVVVGVVLLAAVAGVFVVDPWGGSSTTRADVRRVPASVTGDCSRPVEEEIAQFLATVPDGATVMFGRDQCYGHDGGFQVNDRTGLIVDGNGSTFKPLTDRPDECRATWHVQGGRDIHLRNIIVRGQNTTGFDGPRQPGIAGQCHSGFAFDSVQGGSLTDSKAFDSLADPLSLFPDRRRGDGNYCAVEPNRNILVERFEGFNAGRTVAVTNVDGLTIRDSYFGDIYDNGIDIETDVGCEWSRNVRIINNRFGRTHFGMMTYTGSEPPERSGGLEVIGNIVEAEPENCFVPISIAPFQYPAGQVRRPVVIRDNQLKSRIHGIDLISVGDAVVEGNVVTKNFGTGCASEAYVVSLRSSVNVRVAGNQANGGPLGGFAGEVGADSLTTGVVHDGTIGTR